MKITDKPTKEFINGQLDIKLEHFTDKELDTVLKTKVRKAVGLNEIPLELWKTRKF